MDMGNQCSNIIKKLSINNISIISACTVPVPPRLSSSQQGLAGCNGLSTRCFAHLKTQPYLLRQFLPLSMPN